MPDVELQVLPDQEIQELSWDMFDPDEVRPEVVVTEKPRLPRINIVQSTSSEAIEAGARPGQFIIDWKDPTRPAQFFDKLRVYLIDVIAGRVMFPFTPDGKPDRTTKEPWCASSDGDSPRQSEMFDYVGKKYTDWRNKKEVVITPDCKSCPLQKFISYKDENGKVQNQPPPCQKAPQYVLWLVDQGFAAIFQSSAPTVRNRLDGQPKKGHPGINKFFQPNGVDPVTQKDTYPNIIDNGAGKPKTWLSVRLTAKLETHATGNKTYVPIVELDNTALELAQVKAVFDIKTMYKAVQDGVTMRDILSGQAYLGEVIEYDEDGVEVPAEQVRLTPPGAAAAAKKLGSNGGGKKSMTDKHQKESVDESVEEDGDAF